MTETADQLLSHVVLICQWISQTSRNPSSIFSAYSRFPSVRLKQYHIPRGQFPISSTIAQSLKVEKDAETHFYFNVLGSIQTQGAYFVGDVLDCWVDRDQITNQNFQFKKKILSQVFDVMACNGLHYSILSNYSDTYFLKREEESKTTLHISRVVQPNDTNLTLRECVYYISQLAISDRSGIRLKCIRGNNISSNGFDDADDTNDNSDDNSNDQDYTDDGSSSDDVFSDDDGSSNNYDNDYPSKKIKRNSKKTGSSKKVIASSSKGITTIDEYIGGGTFGKVFSGLYHGQAVAWKTCDTYKKKEAKKSLRVEANMYLILKECQGYVYDGYLYVLTL
ncbi:hypothetical protein Glove_292g97 [Diversispora epigaea]|uniref:Protein kinase domain-containing protein n=1 Tax=Diversispora epigaea TaxID=1348612 RepID=A0A397HZX0_9GLOM|nr:hypothetical protein Glove_292g97 [Diversispora epigaea]